MKKSHLDAPGSWVAAATAGGIIAQQVAGKAVRDALFLTSFQVRSLPFVMVTAALLSLVAVLWVARVMATFAPRRLLLVLFGLTLAALVVEWLSVPAAPRAVAVAVYLHMAVLGPVILSAFWSLINEQFDPHTARAAVARVAMGGTIGGVLGGLGTWRASTLVSVPTTLLLLAFINVLCVVGTLTIPRRERRSLLPPVTERPEEGATALGVLARAPYLRNLALLVAAGSAMSCLLDYVFSAQVTAAFGRGPPLLAFFSLFGLGVSVLSLLLQLSLGRRAMENLGLAVNIAVLPGIIIFGGAVGMATPGLLSATLLRGAEMVHRNTLFRSAYELLYTPLDERKKRATKALIDVGFDRFGTVIGSGVALAAAALSTNIQSILLGVVVLFAITTLPLAKNLHHGYVTALKERLRQGDRLVPVDPEAQQRLTLGFDEKTRDALIAKVEQVRQHDDTPGLAAGALAQGRELSAAVAALLSDDAPRRQRALAGWDRSKLPLVPFGILLLAREEVHVEARRALRTVAEQTTGQLLDALLDPSVDFVIRRRVPAVLAACASQRAADGLLLGLSDERFEVRYACVRALMKVADGGHGITFARERIIEIIEREIDRATTTFSDLDDGSEEEPSPLLDVIARDRVSRSVESLFSLLSLILERDGLRLCFRGLHSESDRQRGTALEYLQTVLPAELREKLLPILSEAGPIPSHRAPKELLAELTSAMVATSFASSESLPGQLRGCCQELVKMGAAFARIWIYDPTKELLELRASEGVYTHLDGPHARVPLGSFKIGRIAATRTPHVTNHVLGDPEVPGQDWARREGMVSFAGYPLVAGDKLMGVVALFARHELSADMLSALEPIAVQIAQRIEREAAGAVAGPG